MMVPKIVGLETEYGIARQKGPASLQATRNFFLGAVPDPIAWDYGTESPAHDAREGFYSATPFAPEGEHRLTAEQLDAAKSVANPDATSEATTDPTVSASVRFTVDRELSTILVNGARFYIDHAHPEYCTPECATVQEVVAQDKAGEYLLMQMVRHYNQICTPEQQVRLYKNNSDHQGHSYGCHENYLMQAQTYENLFNNRGQWLYAYLAPFLVTRQVFCGAGKVGSEHRSDWVDFQISQRADFFERVIGLQTTHTRPIINTRDEPHARPSQFRRLHVICGDANLAEWSTYLKVAVTQLVLAMLEAGGLNLSADVMLADPVAAIQLISQDPTLSAVVDLEHKQRKYKALHIQRIYVEAARRYLDQDRELQATWQQIWEDWARVIDWLETKPEALDSYLDWRIKWNFLRTQTARKDLSWQHPIVRELDVKYHYLDEEHGFFYLLEKRGQIKRWLPATAIEDAMHHPPQSTRAYIRGQLIQKYRSQLVSANWDVLTFRQTAAAAQRLLRLRLPDPTVRGQEKLQAAFAVETSFEDMATALMQMTAEG